MGVSSFFVTAQVEERVQGNPRGSVILPRRCRDWKPLGRFSSRLDAASSLDTASDKKIRVVGFSPIFAGSSVNRQMERAIVFQWLVFTHF